MNYDTGDNDLITYCHIDGRVERLPRGAPPPFWYRDSFVLPQNPISDRERDEIETRWGLLAAERGIEAANEWQYYYVRALLRTKKASTNG